jgi:hypothetical protein
MIKLPFATIRELFTFNMKIELMKFIKLTTNYTEQELDKINSNLEESCIKELDELYSTFQYVRFFSMKKTVCVYAILDDKTIETLVSKYIKLGISFKYEDVSRYVLFGNVPEVDEELSQNELNDMIHYFVGENLDIDIVLDKINELGISQLTEVDKKILELH